MHRTHLRHFLLPGVLAATMLLGTGCNKQSAAPAPMAQPAAPVTQPAPINDNQITAQIERQIASENALAALPIQVQSVNGVVTLSGNVNNDAARELAAADAAQAAGVKTVVNNLVVAPVRAAAPAPRSTPAPPRHPKPRHHQVAENTPPPITPPPPPIAPPPPPITPPVQQAQPMPPPPPVTPPPPPPPKPVAENLTLPPGTDIPFRLSGTLETGVTQSNASFQGALASNLVVDGVVAIPRGSSITGRVIEAKDAAHFTGRAELSLELTQITDQGSQIPLVTQPLLQLGPARGKNTAEKSVGGALLGTLIGALAGGGRGALVGGAAGAGTGAGVNAVTRGQQVNIPAESILHFTLKAPVHVTVMVPPAN